MICLMTLKKPILALEKNYQTNHSLTLLLLFLSNDSSPSPLSLLFSELIVL